MGNHHLPPLYQPQSTPQIDAATAAAIQAALNQPGYYGMNQPQYQQTVNEVFDPNAINRYLALANTSSNMAQTAGDYLAGAAPVVGSWAPVAAKAGTDIYGQDVANARQLASTASGMLGEVGSYDPGGALYNKNLLAIQNAINAQLARQGLGDSGIGAGISSDAITNYILNYNQQKANWQSQLLGAATGAEGTASNIYGAGQTALDTGYNTGAGLYGTAGQMYGAASDYYGAAGSIPYAALSTISNNQQSALLNAQTAYENDVNQRLAAIAPGLQYMGAGVQASQMAIQNQLAKFGFQNQGGAGSSLLGGLAGGFGGALGKGVGGGLTGLGMAGIQALMA